MEGIIEGWFYRQISPLVKYCQNQNQTNRKYELVIFSFLLNWDTGNKLTVLQLKQYKYIYKGIW